MAIVPYAEECNKAKRIKNGSFEMYYDKIKDEKW